jgi:DNA-directed RNA polymerase specialized sigma24 family protein
VVGCSVGTVKSRLHHAKRRLQSEYANSRGDET